MKPKISYEEAREIYEKKGWSVSSIAHRYYFNPQKLKAYFEETGALKGEKKKGYNPTITLEQAVNYYREGFPIYVIASKYKFNDEVLKRKLIEEGIYKLKKKKQYDTKEIIKDYKTGLLTVPEITKKHRISLKNLRNLLLENGVKIRNCGETRVIKKENEIREKVIEDYKDGKYVTDIMSEYHVGYEMVVRILKKAGIERKRAELRGEAVLCES